MGRFVVNRESAAKLGAGLLVAIAVAFSLPALMKSEQPAPLPPDVGLPHAAPAVAPPSAPAPETSAKPRHKHARGSKGKKEKEHRGHRGHRDRDRDRHPGHPSYQPGGTPEAPPPAPVATGGYVAPSPAHDDFGFERP